MLGQERAPVGGWTASMRQALTPDRARLSHSAMLARVAVPGRRVPGAHAASAAGRSLSQRHEKKRLPI